MSKFKRVLILTMALTMMITASVGCSSNVKVTEDDEKTSKSDSKDKDDDKDSDEEDEDDDKDSDDEDKDSEDEDKDSEDEDEDDDKDSDDSDKEDEDSDDEDEKPKKKKESKVDAKTNYVKTKNIIEGTDPDDYIIYDEDGVVVKLVEINGTDATELELVYEVENNSDGEIHVSDDWATLNGIQTSSSFWVQLEPGESEEVPATFDMEGYERYFDTEIGDVTYLLTKYLITDEDYETLYDDYLIIYPDGEENAEFYRRDIESSDELIASNDYVDIYMLDAYEEDIYGYCTDMYIVNNSDKEVYIETDNETVNGEEITSLFGVRLGPGECAYGSNDWFGDEDDIELESGDKVKIEADLLVEDSEFEELDVTKLKISTEY